MWTVIFKLSKLMPLTYPHDSSASAWAHAKQLAGVHGLSDNDVAIDTTQQTMTVDATHYLEASPERATRK